LKRNKTFIYIITACSFIYPFFGFSPEVYAQEGIETTIDCTDVNVNYSDDLTLTREERLRLMDRALFESLNKFELCRSAKKMAKAAETSATDNNLESGAGNSTGEKGNTSAGESLASSTMSGTEPAQAPPPGQNFEAGESNMEQTPQSMGTTDRTASGNMVSSNGKIPEDIPPASNDDALAAQIRYAAEKETDPVKKERLWNEYRKYKGLDLK